MTKATAADFAALVSQIEIGNAMIDAGNNNKADHLAAFEATYAGFDADEAFALHYSANGGGCKGLRALAAAWQSTRAAFLATCVKHGVNKSTASTQWQKGRP